MAVPIMPSRIAIRPSPRSTIDSLGLAFIVQTSFSQIVSKHLYLNDYIEMTESVALIRKRARTLDLAPFGARVIPWRTLVCLVSTGQQVTSLEAIA
jgi:hypothetical protein